MMRTTISRCSTFWMGGGVANGGYAGYGPFFLTSSESNRKGFTDALGTGQLWMTDCLVEECVAVRLAGGTFFSGNLALGNTALVHFTDCTWRRNLAMGSEQTEGGGGVSGIEVVCFMTGCRIEENDAVNSNCGGLGLVDSTAVGTVKDCAFVRNKSKRWGSQMFFIGIVTVTRCTVQGRADHNDYECELGGGCFIMSQDTTVRDSHFEG